ncbi:MAG TPA: HAD-IA family hydrolase [Candidatus Saccharimonadales bacterium]|nr:HAD-IA family hydrolase [Candidatus Saccharimonadales bacterium]
MKKTVDLVMFDLDGTLADTGHDLADAVNFTRAYFDRGALPDQAIYAHVGRGVEHLLKHALPEESPNHFEDVMRVFMGHYEHHLLDRTVLYPGAREILEYFRDKRRVLISNKIERLAVAVVRGLGVDNQFDTILGGDSAAEKKPHPALLNLVLRRFQIPPGRALMVGDGDTDIDAGKGAGVITCGVTYGLGNKDDLIATKPDFLIENLSQLSVYFC